MGSRTNWRRAASMSRTTRCGCSCAERGCASKKTLFALEQGRSDVARRRRRWRSWQAGLDPRRLGFIAGTWIQTSMAAGARLWYLPPYSPDLNPIEQTFAKIKHWMRSAQKRTIDDICRHIGSLLAAIQPGECSNYFENAGYASIKT